MPDTRALKKALNEWHNIFTESRKRELRDLTYELTKRLSALLSKMMAEETFHGWQTWLINVCRDTECSQALGVPVYYTTEHLSRIVEANASGLPRSHALALKMRVDMALDLVRKVIFHPLCPEAIKRFDKTLERLEKSKAIVAKEDFRSDPIKSNELMDQLGDYYKSIEARSSAKDGNNSKDVEKRWRAREILRQSRKSLQDAEFVTILLAIEHARRQATLPKHELKPEKDYSRILSQLKICLTDLVSHTDLLESDVVPWWALAEYAYDLKKNDFPNKLQNMIYKSMKKFSEIAKHTPTYADIINAPRMNASWYGNIEEYAEIPAMAYLLVATPALAVLSAFIVRSSMRIKKGSVSDPLWFFDTKGKGPNIKGTAEKLVHSAFGKHDKKDNKKDKNSNKVGPAILEDDKGLLAAMATRLWALLEFWRWQTVIEVLSCFTDVERRLDKKEKKNKTKDQYFPLESRLFGRRCNNPRLAEKIVFPFPIWQEIKVLPSLSGGATEEAKENGKKLQAKSEKMRGTVFSVMLFGPSGIGKTMLVSELWDNSNENDKKGEKREGKEKGGKTQVIRLDKIPYEMSSDWLDIKKLPASFITGDTARTLQIPEWYYLVFVDEIHLPSVPSAYGLLLKPMEEGHDSLGYRETSGELIPRAFFVLASSAFRKKEEFLAAADRDGNIAMRDLATRIRHWISLPDLYTVPEHKFLVAYTRALDTLDKKKKTGNNKYNARQDAVRITLDLSCGSVRGVVDGIGNKKNNSHLHGFYPDWIIKACQKQAKNPRYSPE